MSEKAILLRESEEAFHALTDAVAGLDEAAMREAWCGTWSLRQIVAHLSGWHREMLPALERLARGERPIPEGVSYDDVDAWNARFAATAEGRATSDLLRELEASHRALMRAADAVPDERYVPGKSAHRIVDSVGRHHYREHGAEILAWRTSTGR